MGYQQLATVIANAVAEATSKRGMAERGTINGDVVITNHGAFSYELAVDINLYNGKSVWVQISADGGTAVIVGD